MYPEKAIYFSYTQKKTKPKSDDRESGYRAVKPKNFFTKKRPFRDCWELMG